MKLTTSLYDVHAMPRQTRKLSNTGTYHVMLRGNNRQDIFDDEDDFQKMLAILKKCAKTTKARIHAYCLMSNHIHLLIQTGAPVLPDSEALGLVMQRIEVSYVRYYNTKTKRIGSLFQERYKSETIDSDTYFLSVLRYIHRNPVKAGFVKSPAHYKWSSYHSYLSADIPDFVYTKTGCEMLGEQFEAYMNDNETDICIDIDEFSQKMTDLELSSMIHRMLGIPASFIPMLSYDERENALRTIMRIKNVTYQQISRTSKIPISTITRILH